METLYFLPHSYFLLSEAHCTSLSNRKDPSAQEWKTVIFVTPAVSLHLLPEEFTSKQTSLFGADCFNCNSPYGELDVPSSGRTFSLVARTVPPPSLRGVRIMIMKHWEGLRSTHKVMQLGKPRSPGCVWRTLCYQDGSPVKWYRSSSVHCSYIYRELLPNGATFSIRKREYAKEHEYQLSFTCIKNYTGAVVF